MDKKEKFQLIAIHAVITTIIVLAITGIFGYFGNTFEKAENAASIDYVNKANEKQDAALMKIVESLNVSINLKADKTYVDDENKRMYELLLIIDGRVYDLWAKANGYNNRGEESTKRN